MTPSRRTFLHASAAAGLSSIAGCLVRAPQPDRSLSTPTLGDPEAPIVLASFEDFRCGYCRQFNREILPRVIDRYVTEGIVQFQRFDYPFVDPEWSWKAASAAREVQAQADDETYFAYVDL
ncbi:MAG: thioredoxin domain-containing protein [Halodesulfurarchaeum sp.]